MIMMWMLTWLNVSAAALNATFQLLVIYRFAICYLLMYESDFVLLEGLKCRFIKYENRGLFQPSKQAFCEVIDFSI